MNTNTRTGMGMGTKMKMKMKLKTKTKTKAKSKFKSKPKKGQEEELASAIGWSEEEDKKLFTLYKQLGSRWVEIAGHFRNKDENQIKNRFYSTLRRVATKRQRQINPTSSAAIPKAKADLLQYVDDALEYGHYCMSKRGRKKKKPDPHPDPDPHPESNSNSKSESESEDLPPVPSKSPRSLQFPTPIANMSRELRSKSVAPISPSASEVGERHLAMGELIAENQRLLDLATAEVQNAGTPKDLHLARDKLERLMGLQKELLDGILRTSKEISKQPQSYQP